MISMLLFFPVIRHTTCSHSNRLKSTASVLKSLDSAQVVPAPSQSGPKIKVDSAPFENKYF